MAQAIYPPNTPMENLAKQQLILQRPEVTKMRELDRIMATILSKRNISPDERMREYEKALLQFRAARDDVLINGTQMHANTSSEYDVITPIVLDRASESNELNEPDTELIPNISPKRIRTTPLRLTSKSAEKFTTPSGDDKVPSEQILEVTAMGDDVVQDTDVEKESEASAIKLKPLYSYPEEKAARKLFLDVEKEMNMYSYISNERKWYNKENNIWLTPQMNEIIRVMAHTNLGRQLSENGTSFLKSLITKLQKVNKPEAQILLQKLQDVRRENPATSVDLERWDSEVRNVIPTVALRAGRRIIGATKPSV